MTNMMRKMIGDGLIVNVKLALAGFEDWDLRKRERGLKGQRGERISKAIGFGGVG